MKAKLARIEEIGFKIAGCWTNVESDNGIRFDLSYFASEHNVLYSFVVNGELMYVGKTTMSLQHRMQRYKTPASSSKNGGSTNINNNRNIHECLQRGETVEIYVLPDNGLLHYGKFHVSLAAGLEDDVVKQLEPPWNGGRKESPQQSLVPVVDENPAMPE